ncbi:MAG TPA: dTDP-4-dehydrorhamnose 3,5-epimerase family protein [Acetobacteraceae bacterium]|nr:dTDP-4-dehydrorhamnose 3,5-epimerase family protein [Acetobacteraceae bacterium]
MSMRLIPTPLSDVFVLRSERARDTRGSFLRLSCISTLAANGVAFSPRQASLSRSTRRGTLRGLHFQQSPSAETKIIHCVAGAVFDVALDLRPDSLSFGQAFGTELSADNGDGMLIAAGCAHGLLTLVDDTAVLYQIDRDYDPASARGVRWNDPSFAIAWPFAPVIISERDTAWPDFPI